MKSKWLLGGAGGVVLLAALDRRRRQQKQQTGAAARLRRQFPRIARMRLVGACPALDTHLRDHHLERIFDWVVDQLCRRSGACNFTALLEWATEQGQPAMNTLASDVSRDAVERLPRRALAIIDDCHGRAYAAAVLDLSLSEAAHRAAPDVTKQP